MGAWDVLVELYGGEEDGPLGDTPPDHPASGHTAVVHGALPQGHGGTVRNDPLQADFGGDDRQPLPQRMPAVHGAQTSDHDPDGWMDMVSPDALSRRS